MVATQKLIIMMHKDLHACFDIKEIDKIWQTGNRIADEVKKILTFNTSFALNVIMKSILK